MHPRIASVLFALALALAPAAASAAPFFTEATARLGAPQPCGPGEDEGCYSNYVVMADLDGDGDLDAVFASGGGYYEPGNAERMALYLNDGEGTFVESSTAATSSFAGRLRQVAVGDIDGDGDNDLIAPDAWAMQADAVFVNDGARPPVFANEGAARLGTSSRAGATRLADVDDDGDLDLLITDWGPNPPGSAGTAKLYRNDGTGHFAEIAGAIPQDTSGIGTGPIDADFFDADGDFDLDLVLASREGESLLFLNDGTGVFADANKDVDATHQDRLPDQSGPYVYGPDECDVDGDGDLDLWLDNGYAVTDESISLEQLVINDGNGLFTDETATRVSGNADADDNEVQCVDLDGDGDLDAIVASLADNERVLVNDGTGRFAALADGFPTVADPTLGLDLGDVDGDGRLDAITAQGEGTPKLNRLYLGTDAQPVDTRAPVLRAVQTDFAGATAGRVTVHFAVADAATSDVGPRLREAHVTLEAGGADVPARFMGGDLFRAELELAEGTHAYRACATDAAGNSACSEPTTIVVGAPGQVDAGPTPPPGDAHDGCGCRVGGAHGGAAGGLVILVVLALSARYWRGARRQGRRAIHAR